MSGSKNGKESIEVERMKENVGNIGIIERLFSTYKNNHYSPRLIHYLQ